MGDHDQGGSPLEHAVHGALEILRVKCRKALIENDDIGVLQECPSYVQAAPLAMGELPSRLSQCSV